MPSSVADCQGCKKPSEAGWEIWMGLFLFRGQGVTTISRNVIGPQGRSLKHGPMCSPWEGNKPLSHKESMNKVRALLAVGINEIHPLLIVPSKLKGLAEGKGHTVEGETKKRSTMSLQRMLSLFGSVQPGGTSPVFVLTSPAPSEFPIIQTKTRCWWFQQHCTRRSSRRLH